MIRYGISDVDKFTPGTFPLVGGMAQPQRFQNVALGLTSIISPRFLNEFRRQLRADNQPPDGPEFRGSDRVSGRRPLAPASGESAGFVESLGLSNTAITGLGETQPWFLTVNTFQFYDGVTWSHGKHNIKAGADVRRHRADAFSVRDRTTATRSRVNFPEMALPIFSSGICRIHRSPWLRTKSDVFAAQCSRSTFSTIGSQSQADAEHRSSVRVQPGTTGTRRAHSELRSEPGKRGLAAYDFRVRTRTLNRFTRTFVPTCHSAISTARLSSSRI